MICWSHAKREDEDCIDCDRTYYSHTQQMLECDERVHGCRIWHVLYILTCDWADEEQDDDR